MDGTDGTNPTSDYNNYDQIGYQERQGQGDTGTMDDRQQPGGTHLGGNGGMGGQGQDQDQFATDQGVDDRNDRQNEGRFEVADEAADEITSEVDGVDSAYVIAGGRNAYVAIIRDDNQNQTQEDDVDDDLEQEIKDAVQDTDPNINDVYVSTNPDFIDLANRYTEDVEALQYIYSLNQ